MSQLPSWPIGPMTSDQWVDQFQILNHRMPTAEEYRAASQRGHISNAQLVPAQTENTQASQNHPEQPAPLSQTPQPASQPLQASSMPLLAPLPKKERSWRNRTYLWCSILSLASIAVGIWALFQERLHIHYELQGEILKRTEDTRYSWLGLIEYIEPDDLEAGTKAAQANYSYDGYIILILFILCVVLLVLSCTKRLRFLRSTATTVLVVSSGSILMLSIAILRMEHNQNEFSAWYEEHLHERGDTLAGIYHKSAGIGMTTMVLVSVILLITSLVMMAVMISARRAKKR
ncbi:MAG: hypothetical protein Q4P78_02360 [Rothia sp. (in: high G+C Gram-positive bacteria)]|uniref:hypothetical protein n=1 Tax=Rothia sp. (in: high G+C Gram-positive bacteria) TaxID=1885016 RepID=UPI0026DFFA15|nr:hypothetical protein [Rothia sp. (in: high G+C Gram-positive bacteria)]MDO5750030.1 hypothetical protein [Rothia sp. (in: high G+C Gram-positive bacteria)]